MAPKLPSRLVEPLHCDLYNKVCWFCVIKIFTHCYIRIMIKSMNTILRSHPKRPFKSLLWQNCMMYNIALIYQCKYEEVAWWAFTISIWKIFSSYYRLNQISTTNICRCVTVGKHPCFLLFITRRIKKWNFQTRNRDRWKKPRNKRVCLKLYLVNLKERTTKWTTSCRAYPSINLEKMI